MPKSASHSWLSGESEMVRRIREHDWGATPLRPLEQWPVSLRSALTLVLGHPLPMVMGWGSSLITIYNDAYRPLLRAKDEALGRPFLEVWEEARDIIAPQIAEALAGQTVRFENARFTLVRDGAPKEAWFDYSISSLRDDAGMVAGMLNTAFERTAHVLAEQEQTVADAALREGEKRQAFLLNFSDALREEADVDAIAHRAIGMLTEHLKLDRCYIAYYRPAEDAADFPYQVGNDRLPPLPASVRLSDFPAAYGQAREQTFVVDDDFDRTGLSEAEQATSQALGMRAMVASTARRGERNPLSSLVAVSASPRRWVPEEVALVEVAAERTWAAMETAYAEAAVRSSEEKYRALFESIDEGICVIEVIEARDGVKPDFRVVEANEAHGRQTGLRDVVGKLGSEITPGAESYWHDAYAEIVRTGEPKRVENYNQDTRIWYDIFASRVGGAGSHLVCVVSQDTTERREREQRQSYLLQLSDILQRLTVPTDIKTAAMHMLGTGLGVSRAQYHEVDDSGEYYDADGIGYADGLPLLKLKYRIDQFGSFVGEDFRAGRPFRSDDLSADPRPTPEERTAYGTYGIRAGAGIPLLRGGRLVAILAVHDTSSRRWTDLEMELIHETAERVWVAVEKVRAGLTLRESEARNRLLVGSWAQAVWETDADGIVVADSPSWRAYTGQTLEEWLGYGWLDAIHPDDRAEIERRWREAVRARDLVDAEYRLHAPNGEWRWTNVRAVPVIDAKGRVEKWAGMNIDITSRRQAEAALQESEMRFREFGENSSDALWIIDAETGQLEYLSPAYERIWGESRAAVMADISLWAELVHPDDRAAALQAMPHLLAGKPFQADYRIIRPDGEVRWIRDAGFPIMVDGVVKRAGGIAQDVTDLKRAEAAVRESETRFREFGEASQDILWIRDAETLQWQYLTPAFEAIYGLSRDDALSGNNYRSWLELIVPEDRPHAMENIRRVKAGEQVAFEFRIRRPADGAIRWLRNTDFPIRDGTGDVALIGGIGHDFTDLRETELRLQALIEGIPQMVWRASEPGLWTWASPQWTAFTGQEEEDSHDWGWLEPMHPDDRDMAREAWGRAVESGELAFEYRLCGLVGSYRWFQSRAVPVRDKGGEIVEWLGTSTDIHDLRLLQDRQQVMVQELQHRTRNLITVVNALSKQTLKNAASLGDFDHHFSDRLSALSRVQGLLSHLTAGKRVTFDELLGSELKALGAPDDKVTLDGPRGVPLRSAMVQTFSLALHELATNALKYGALAASGGHLTVRWGVAHTDRDGPRLQVDWRETGVVMTHVEAAPRGGGYGRELIERALPYQLDAETTYELTDSGVHCTIDVPASTVTAGLD